MVTVYNFEFYDTNKGKKIIPRRKCTFEEIYRNRGKIIPETAQIVDAARIYDGNYIPPPEFD